MTNPRRYLALLLSLVLVGCLIPGFANAQVVSSGALCNETSADTCNQFKAEIEFAQAGISADVLLTFEEAGNLAGGNLVVTATLVDPRDPAVMSRLSKGVFVPADFPVMISINPRSGGPLQFRGAWNLEIETENLEFSSHTPLRLFRGEAGRRFDDISQSLGAGSFRVRGAGGQFSDFMILADHRPVDAILREKIDKLTQAVNASVNDIPDAAPDLLAFLDSLNVSLDAKEFEDAVATVADLINYVKDNSGGTIPNDTRPGEGVVGVTGRLLGTAESLRFSLLLVIETDTGEVGGFRQSFALAGGPTGSVEFDVFVEFSEAFSVDQSGLEITAEIIDHNSPEILARLPESVRVPEEFPVLVRMTPDAEQEQAFSGMAQFEIRTEALDFIGNTPVRLFKAPDGGAFEDVTFSLGFGSMRIRGGGRQFSEFVLGLDLRPPDEIAADKIARLRATLDEGTGEIPAATVHRLSQLLDNAEASLAEGNGRGAADQLEAFIEEVGDAGGDIPSLWRSDEGDNNIAGGLTSLAESLRFSLLVAERPVDADPGDVNRDGQVDVSDVLLLIEQVFGDSTP